MIYTFWTDNLGAYYKITSGGGLWISGLIETGGITKLVVSAKGEGGLRVMLKPKPNSDKVSSAEKIEDVSVL